MYIGWLIVLAVSLAVHAPASAIEREARCEDFLPQVKSVFQDIHGEILKDERIQLELLSKCARRARFCIVVENSNNSGYSSVEINSLSAPDFSVTKNQIALAMLGVFKSRTHHHVCALARYSGGSAATWEFDVWHKNIGGIQSINTDAISVHADTLSPNSLIKIVSKSVYGLR